MTSTTTSTFASDMVAKAQGKTTKPAVKTAPIAAPKAPAPAFVLMNSATAGGQLRAYFIAALQMAGVVTKTGLPTAKGGSLAWFKANCQPAARAVQHHSQKGSLEVSGGTLKLVAGSALANDFTKDIAKYEALIAAYADFMKTGKVSELIIPAKGAAPAIKKPK